MYEIKSFKFKNFFQLMKVENGLLDGEVLYHDLIVKTEEEKLLIEKKREKKKKLKENRKKIQEVNKKRKELKKEEAKEKSLKGMKKKQSERDILIKKIAKESADLNKIEDDDDAQYYRDEVGEEPDKGLFLFIFKFTKFLNKGLIHYF